MDIEFLKDKSSLYGYKVEEGGRCWIISPFGPVSFDARGLYQIVKSYDENETGMTFRQYLASLIMTKEENDSFNKKKD